MQYDRKVILHLCIFSNAKLGIWGNLITEFSDHQDCAGFPLSSEFFISLTKPSKKVIITYVFVYFYEP